MQNENFQKVILALVGMPGAGKTEASSHLQKKGIPFVRFGQITEDEVVRLGLKLTQENERIAREKIRKEEGMGAYAFRAKPKIDQLLKTNNVLVIDGLYSWEEYTFLKKEFSDLLLIHIYAEPQKRYERLLKRPIRKLSKNELRLRDIAELEKLNKGGPIAIADYLVENNSDDINNLYKKLDALMSRLGVKNG